MLRPQVVVALIVAISSSFCQEYGGVPEYLLPFFPEQFIEYLETVTPAETKELQEMAKSRGPFKERGMFMYALSKSGKNLYKKHAKLEFDLRRKIGFLDGDAKNLAIHFVNNAHSIYMNLLSGKKPVFTEINSMIVSYIDEFNKLSEESKAALAEQFPTFVDTISMPLEEEILKPGRAFDFDYVTAEA